MIRVFLIVMFIAACKSSKKDANISIHQITIQTGKSYKIDLAKETYTVYFFNGSSYNCQFSLSDQDKLDILKMSQACGLSDLTGDVQIEDDCTMFPKVLTELSFYAGDSFVHVSIDAGCTDHPFFKKKQPREIQRFLKFVQKKVASKPAVLKAPKSDVRYM